MIKVGFVNHEFISVFKLHLIYQLLFTGKFLNIDLTPDTIEQFRQFSSFGALHVLRLLEIQLDKNHKTTLFRACMNKIK